MFEQVSLSDFQTHYWRKKPLRLGQLDMSHLDSLSFDDFLELAGDQHIESRILKTATSGFEVNFGPFQDLTLETNSMLMLQNLESFSYQISYWLTQHFGFLPRWRVEDVMATISDAGGTCGAHYDQYDVFLVQLQGTKTWELDEGSHTADDLVVDSDVRLLAEFSPTSSFTQGPGDVLYIPPGFGHHGVANDACVTLSVGIRNPLMTEMASHLADLLLQEQETSASLSDELTGLTIRPQEVTQLGQKLSEAMTSKNLMNVWYGSYMTLPRDPELIDSTLIEDLNVSLWRRENDRVYLDLPARIAVQDQWLFVNGEALALETEALWLTELQQKREVDLSEVPKDDNYLLFALIQSGAVLLYPDE